MDYTPRQEPRTFDAHRPEVRAVFRFLYDELRTISEVFTARNEDIRVVERGAAPDRPRDGTIAYADGTSWNPGYGEGFYAYVNGVWEPMASVKDFYTEVVKGNVSGHSIVHSFGKNDAVANGTWEVVSSLSTTVAFLSSATAVRVKAGGDAADDAAGNNAREVTIYGLDETGALANEAVATAGASASSATTTTFIRIFSAAVTAVGTYGAANAAAITIENSAGTQDLITIPTGEGETESGYYTIPLAKTGYLFSLEITAEGSQEADFRLLTRQDILDTSAPMSSVRIKRLWRGVAGPHPVDPKDAIVDALPALTDVWIEAEGAGASAEVSVNMEILLVDD